jgi:hypothetical protein
MKSLRYVLFFLTVLLVATATRAQQTGVKADVPFDFLVGTHAYPAGEYTVKSMSTSGIMIRIDNTQIRATAITLSDKCDDSTVPATSRLVFHRLGGSYFLYQVSTERSACRELSTSRTEVQLAKKLEKSEPVIVAAKITQ